MGVGWVFVVFGVAEVFVRIVIFYWFGGVGVVVGRVGIIGCVF